MTASERVMAYPGDQMAAQPVPIVTGAPQVQVQPQIVVNQVTPAVAVITPAVKSTPYLTVCPFCKNQVMTSTIRTFNCCTCLLCYCTGLICFLIIQSCRGKDLSCYDADHRCPNCGQTLGRYESC